MKHATICGFYFSYFAKTMPELELTKWHPYIRSCINREEAAMASADAEFSVGVLELSGHCRGLGHAQDGNVGPSAGIT